MPNKKKNILGETRVMNNGMKATVIADRGTRDIDVQFEDGNIIFGKQRRTFKRGEIRNPNVRNLKSIIGQTMTMNNGMRATVIADREFHNIDIQFEDGTIVCNRTRQDFRKGHINNPNIRTLRSKKTIVGETRVMNNGMRATVIADRGAFDVDIQFEDGTIVYNKYRNAFRRGFIKKTNVKKLRSDYSETNIKVGRGKNSIIRGNKS